MAINNPVIADADIIQDTAVAVQEKDHGGKMEFPDIPSRIRALPTQDNALLNSLINRSITSIENSEVTSIGNYAFAYCNNLTNIVLKNAMSLGSYFIAYDTNLNNLEIPEVRLVNNHYFDECGLRRLFLRSVTSMGSGRAFVNCANLFTIIMGKRATLGSANVISGANNAIFYVQPNDLSWYSTATNWSTLYAGNRIKSIEDLTGDDLVWYQEQLARYPIEEAS